MQKSIPQPESNSKASVSPQRCMLYLEFAANADNFFGQVPKLSR